MTNDMISGLFYQIKASELRVQIEGLVKDSNRYN